MYILDTVLEYIQYQFSTNIEPAIILDLWLLERITSYIFIHESVFDNINL